MIPFDFSYYKPDTPIEALEALEEIERQGKTAVLFSGGTEFITFARTNQLKADAVIDLKGIPECNGIEIKGDQLVMGSCVSLNRVIESGVFPLMEQTLKRIADHTSRNKISLGGNLNSRLAYREAILPLLLTDAKVKISGGEGETVLPIAEVFDHDRKLEKGQILLQVLVPKAAAENKFFYLKRTKFSMVGYPIVSLAAIVSDKQIRAAFSGICGYPFRSKELEKLLNDTSISIEERINRAQAYLPAPVLEDILASKEYREFVFKTILTDALEALKEA